MRTKKLRMVDGLPSKQKDFKNWSKRVPSKAGWYFVLRLTPGGAEVVHPIFLMLATAEEKAKMRLEHKVPASWLKWCNSMQWVNDSDWCAIGNAVPLAKVVSPNCGARWIRIPSIK